MTNSTSYILYMIARMPKENNDVVFENFSSGA